MKNKTLLIFLIINSLIFGGCSMLSPFKSINECSDVKNNGATCSNVESNLEYSVGKDNPSTTDTIVPEREKDKKATDTDEPLATVIHSEEDVKKDEIVRLMAEMSIDSNITKKPTLIPSSTYRLLIFPYSVGERFYSARYVYIRAGTPKWITGNYILSDGQPIQVNTPIAKVSVKKMQDTTTEVDVQPVKEQVTDIMPKKTVKHRVSAYLLNCRDMPGLDGTSIAVFEQDRVLDITDKSLDWWKVSFYETECYVNPKYLYSEPEQ